MHEIRDLVQGFSFPADQECGIYKYTIFFRHIVIVSGKNFHNMVKKYRVATDVDHIVGYLGNCEALHEITDHMHEMLSVCAP